MKTSAPKIFAVLVLASALHSQATTIYSNTNPGSDQGLVLGAVDNTWFGDEVLLAGADRYLTSFGFEYWSSNTTALTVDVKLLLNDGTPYSGYDSPDSVIYQYFGLALNPSTADGYPFRGGVTFDVSDFGSPLFINGDNVTLALNFHFSQGEAGPTMYTVPDVGTAYNDYWELNGGNWQLVTNNAISVVNFGMQINAVPEPSSFALIVLGAASLLGFHRFCRRK